ncbi:fumarylacetoacetate hydrolase [Acidovorax sp. SUPP2522]|uniref:2-keto-4-pentenoate hydratase n=1 Tax=unclassified Acidovorax TaxID=2684926 RepID=UPI00234BEA8B|nr:MULTISPECIES: fumarylacetoacetate hydrolase [unclassified Acidovorax]WCM99492.1 fumarylacetoacetate hydrolase [Acidovorax sp. GBBC 1281]GKT18888.1 fumarylacetoacetate hydrolase [Acidovorax sp. SUPP2522]
MAMQQTLIAAVLAVACATTAQAECLSDVQVAELAAHYSGRTPAANLPPLSDADAACTRAKFNALLAHRLGRVVGYKAGLTNPAVQKRFGTDKPVWGKLYEGMVLRDGALVDAAFGARPLFEADMLVRVKSAAINHARTPMEVLEHIDQVIPFIELPDLLVQAPPQLNGAGVAAINVGARLGVAGAPIAVPRLRAERYAMVDALQNMAVTLTDGQGARLGGGRGSDILGHPLNAVVWLAEALAKEDIILQPGDLVSLGSFSALLPPRPGLEVTATFDGLPGAAPVHVTFR